MAHFINSEPFEIFANVLVDSRPRFAQFNDQGTRLYVSSAEIGGSVSVIDPATQAITKRSPSRSPGVLPEAIQPVGVRVSTGRQPRLCRAGPGEPRGGDRRRHRRGAGLSAGRPARLADGPHPGRNTCSPPTAIRTTFRDRDVAAMVVKSVPVGQQPGAWWWRRIDPERNRHDPFADRPTIALGLAFPPLPMTTTRPKAKMPRQASTRPGAKFDYGFSGMLARDN